MADPVDWHGVQTMYETPATLSAEQLRTLKEFWSILLIFFADTRTNLTASWATAFPPDEDAAEDADTNAALIEFSGKTFRDEFYRLLRHDYADFVPMKFLRARSYDRERAMKMLINALAFRRKNIPKAMMSETKPDAEFLEAMRRAKTFVPCYDCHGRTITCIRIKNHARGDCSLDCFERYTLYQMEHAHLLHKPLQDRTVLMVDMTGFSVTALDISAIKFLILNFEQYYPEELYEGIIHNAPWLFSSAWALIKPLLRQATRDKITFTSNVKDLAAKIGEKEAETVLKAQLQYIPRPADEEFKNETENMETASDECKAACKTWQENCVDMEELTRQWSRPPASDTPLDTLEKLDAQRSEACWRLSKSYWAIDPFVRPKSYYDRAGQLPPGDSNALNLKVSKPGTPTTRPPSLTKPTSTKSRT